LWKVSKRENNLSTLLFWKAFLTPRLMGLFTFLISPPPPGPYFSLSLLKGLILIIIFNTVFLSSGANLATMILNTFQRRRKTEPALQESERGLDAK